MNFLRVGLVGMALATGVSLAHADRIEDVESARANARAGGPVSEHDAELLKRHGCLSGTRSRFCEKLDRRVLRNERQRSYR